MMLVDHMEAAFGELKDFDLSPNLNTYNIVLSGYVTAWMWDGMETTLSLMKASFVEPDRTTRGIMIRGYAHSGNIQKMEETYALVKDQFVENDAAIIRIMITAYCKSKLTDRVEKIEALLKVIPESEYRPWLNVMLIKVYAQEGLLLTMEKFIDQAFAHNTVVISTQIMHAVISSYYRSNALERFERFVTRAESSGWKICRSLYHCKMVMYGFRNRLKEMENVLNEMDARRLTPTRKTFLIMSLIYLKWGEITKAKQVSGMMIKHGYNVSIQAGSS
uniref:Pentatricopeptide repeat-containing protein n=1 Tax=Kalanchoe fedtschenkoi TaxID=63787 RepID=A0A7N0SYF0_KALFE